MLDLHRLELHRRALRQSVDLVDLIGDDQWALPTPCAEWDLRQLVEHMTLDNRGFAAAAGGERADTAVWSARDFGPDLRAEYARSAERVVAAFRSPAPEFWLPRITPDTTFAADRAIGFHLLDYLAHGWDVAAATGRPVDYPADLVAAVQEIADRDVPNGPNRLRAGASFRPALPAQPDESALDHLLRTLGRSPSWPG
ncbi:TIGR03086 family metal-binding protein [Plantactinospora siamensis]|uniref:TIGR03086 family metal-binding protein n=1 Tax=Plantactinospora siamensis TaxID=555372 RepID=A0ABV6NY90_9ACTN